MSSIIRRIFWLVLFIGGLGWLIGNGIREVRHEKNLRTLLLTVQTALQDYHVDQERYIPREKLTGTETIMVLSDFEFLKQLPINPWTQQTWKLDETETDFLIYETDPNFETYSLQAMDPKTGKVALELDSEENPSLE